MQKKNSSKSAVVSSENSGRFSRKGRRGLLNAALRALPAMAAGAALFPAHSAPADTIWNGASANWSLAADWSAGLPDTGTQNAVVNSGVCTITGTQLTFDCNAGEVASQSGTYTMTSGTLALGRCV